MATVLAPSTTISLDISSNVPRNTLADKSAWLKIFQKPDTDRFETKCFIPIPESTKLPGGYALVRILSEAGGFFNRGISLVRDLNNDQVVLCKTLPAGGADAEIKFLKRLTGHSHITKLHEYIPAGDRWVCNHPGKPCWQVNHLRQVFDRICLEYCDRGTLNSVIEEYRNNENIIPEDFIWHVFESLAKALQLCHFGKDRDRSENDGSWDPIIHRDIIPSNVLLTSNSPAPYPHVVLGDFGCAVEKSSVVRNGIYSPDVDLPVQDPQFLAPESDAKGHLEAADIYQTGLVIWCLCYRVAQPTMESMRPILDREVKEGTWGYSEKLRILLNRCLSHTPSLRPNADALVEEIGLIKR